MPLRPATRRLAPLLAAATLLSAAPGVADAASGTFNCAGLQDGLNQASNGDTITLNDVCTKDNSGDAHGSFTLPSGVAITLQGVAGSGFDGAGAASRILTGNSVGSTKIFGLTFRNGRAPAGEAGGAVLLDGNSAPTFDNDQFFGNVAEGVGGAVALLAANAVSGTVVFANSILGSRGAAAPGNGAAAGGAIFIQTSRHVEVRGNLFGGNVAVDTGGGLAIAAAGGVSFSQNLVEGNEAGAGGGGAQLCCGQLQVVSNAFRANKVNDPLGRSNAHAGGGLLVSSPDGGGGQVIQFGNVFDGNSVSFTADAASISGGGGELVSGSNLSSRNDLFVSNALQGPSSGGESRGGGLRASGCGGGSIAITLENVAVAGNTVGAGGGGAGVSAACGRLTLLDTTVAGNAGAAAVDGGGGDALAVGNSIVSPPAGAPGVSGFSSRGVSFTDLCDPGAPDQPLPGEGNICADPHLVNPGSANFHQTAGSPTVDAGNNSLVSPDLGVDLDGSSRVTDGNGDGDEVVDMGADESAAVALIPRQHTPPPTTGGVDVPGPPPPSVVITQPPNKPVRVVYVRIIITRHHGRYLVTRITGRGRARIRLRLLDGKGRSHSVTRTVRTNRAVTVKELPLVGVRSIRVSVLS
jgi:hypothetical protein